MTRVDESGNGHAHAGGVAHDVVVAIAGRVVEPAGELRQAHRDGWIRHAELEPLGAEDGAGLDPATVDEPLQPGVCFGRFRVS
jgi:hypothetical protein